MDKWQPKKKPSLSTVKSMEKITSFPTPNDASGITSPHQVQRKQMKAEANEVKSKMGKFLQKYKSKMGEIKKVHIGLNFNTNSQNLKQNSSYENTGISLFRTKNNIILQKGCNVPSKKNLTAPTGQYELKKIRKEKKQNPEQLHPLTKNIKHFSETLSTNSSLGSHPFQKKVSLKDFEIGQKLGSGKYGEVYAVKHKMSGMILALKKIRKEDVDQIGKKQLLHEIKIQLFIEHPNVVKMYAYFCDKQYIYLILELCTSGHLYNFLQQKVVIPEKMVKNIVKQVCQGLQHLHDYNIIHRDVKLENILYQMGMVKICDFGWSIQTEDLRQTFCGTPLYIAPQILLQKGYDHKIDVWCVGILTYELLYGVVPFQIREQSDFRKIVYQQLQFPDQPQISNQAKEFVYACLNKDPQFRPQFKRLMKFSFIDKCQPIILHELF